MPPTSISSVELLTLAPSGAQARLLARVTAQSGAWGVGEIGCGVAEEHEETVEELAVQALGWNLLDREGIWQAMAGAATDWDGPPEPMARCLAGLDMALWDLAGRHLGLPCVTLAGGRVRRSLEACLDCGALGAEAASLTEQWFAGGLRMFAVTVDLADPGTRDGIRRLRKIVGPQSLLMFRTASPAADPEQAKEWGVELDRVDPYWVEGLVADGQFRELGDLRNGIAAATATGADTLGLKRLGRTIESACADVVTPRLALAGGITGALKLAAVAELRGLRLCVLPGDTLASLLAAAHVSFARPDVYPLVGSPELLASLDASGLLRDGLVSLPDAPGLGIPEGFLDASQTHCAFGADEA
jgi:L-alanine-DL-glutamate epimerase-like enolase superfamily enzyme